MLALIVFLQSCASQPKKEEPKGEWLWYHSELYSKLTSEQITNKEVDYIFTVARNKCKIEGLKVSIPSPSCYVVPANCEGLTGFARGFCRGIGPKEKCNYSSVIAAKEAQTEITEACMELNGWELQWKPLITQ